MLPVRSLLPAAPRLVAHRGAPLIARENTLPAIATALDAGAAAVEVDLRRTADGAAVLLHDATLERLWGDPRAVADLPLDEVRRIGGGAADGLRIPTLGEALSLVAARDADGVGPVLVLDLTGPEDAAAAVDALRAHPGPLPRLEWCGAPAAMAVVRAGLPAASVWLAWYERRAPAAADVDTATLRPSVLNLDVALLSAATVDAAHELGLVVSCWTVDDPDLARRAAALGVDSITTNDLPRIAAALGA